MKKSLFVKFSFISVSVVLLLVFSSVVCWAVKPKKMKDGTGMVYGRVILPPEMKDGIDRIQIFKVGTVYAPPFKKPPRVIFSPSDGYFLAENLQPGSYFIDEVAAGFESFYFYQPKMKEAKETVHQNSVEVRPGEVTYLGTFEIYDWKRGLDSKMSPKVGKVRFLANGAPNSPPSTIPNFIAGSSSFFAAGAGNFKVKRSTDSAQDKKALQFVLELSEGTGWDAKVGDGGALPPRTD